MINTTEIYRLLAQMRGVVIGSEALRGVHPEVTTAWADDAAVRQIGSLIERALVLMGTEPIPSSGVAATEQHRSSVEIESRAKGEPGLKVKAYTGSDLEDPAARAVEMFRRLKAQLAEEAKVKEGTAS